MSYSLFIYAEKADEIAISSSQLTDYLLELEFCSLHSGTDSLVAGAQLMDYITFMGCSASLPQGEVGSQIRVHRFQARTAMGGESVETVYFPQCRHPLKEPTKLLASTTWRCPECGNQGKVADINWRKSAGYSSVFIEVSHIFPKEAIPADKLLASLKSFANSDWEWFYSKSTV